MDKQNIDNMAKLTTTFSRSFRETNDCTVRALSNGCHIPYPQAHNILRKHYDREHRKGMFFSHIMEVLCSEFISHDAHKNGTMTISQFCKRFPKGRYFVTIRRHAIAIVDGVPQDWTTTKSRHHVWLYGEVKEEAVRMTNAKFEEMKNSKPTELIHK